MKTVLFLTLLALGASNSPDDEGGESAANQETNVLERYNLRPVLPRIDAGTEWTGLLTLLMPPWWGDDGEVEVHGLHTNEAPDKILNLVTQALGDALNAKGSQIVLENDSTLLVLAPAPVQSMVAEVLGVLESVLSSSVEVRVDVISLDGVLEGAGQGSPARSVVSAAEADRLVEGLVARGATHREHTIQLSSGRTSAVDQSSTAPVVFDYDVEIAQGAFIWDPIVLDVMEGVRLFVRGVPKPTGTLVSAMIVQGDLLNGVQDRPLDLHGAVSHEQSGGLSFVAGPQSIQTVELLTRSVAFTSFLPEGQAIVVSSRTKLGGTSASHFIVMRQLGKTQPAFVSTKIRGTNRTLALVNAELFRAPEFQIVSQPHVGEMSGFPIVAATLSAEYSSFLYDWLRYRYSVWSPIGPWVAVVTDPAWDARGAEALEELVLSAETDAELVEVQVDMVTSADEADPPARWSLPILAGTACGTVLGISSTAVRDYDVEVAQYAAVPDPFVQPTFNGLALSLEVSAGRGGSSWTLDVQGTGQFFRGPVPTFESDGPVNGRIDRPEYDVLNINERKTLPRQQGNVSRVRIGTQVRRAERGVLSLVVTIRG